MPLLCWGIMPHRWWDAFYYQPPPMAKRTFWSVRRQVALQGCKPWQITRTTELSKCWTGLDWHCLPADMSDKMCLQSNCVCVCVSRISTGGKKRVPRCSQSIYNVEITFFFQWIVHKSMKIFWDNSMVKLYWHCFVSIQSFNISWQNWDFPFFLYTLQVSESLWMKFCLHEWDQIPK